MPALHAGGRPAEALDAYAEMRERLVAELGTELGIQPCRATNVRGRCS